MTGLLDDYYFFFGQPIEIIHQLVNLFVRRFDLTLIQCAVTRFAPRGGLCW